jgi:hypothetical protein
MLKVDHQSGGFTPWNEICPKKYLSPGIPVVPLWQNSCNLSCAIPLGPAPPAPLNRVHPACPMECYFPVYSIGVKFTPVISKRISLGTCQLDIAFTFELSAMFTP